MRSFVFGVAVGAMGMFFYLEGFDPILSIAEGWWLNVSRPQAAALQQ